MSSKSIQDLFPLVNKPSQYLGCEINAIHKNHDEVKLKTVLAFPDLYEIGTSHFGMQILYHLLNRQKDILAERVFAPGEDMELLLRKNDLSLFSLESGKPLREFDLIGFSLLYELNYTNILTMLELSNIPFYSKDRHRGAYPLIIAGGPSMCNPEPVADFFDAIVIGDGEHVLIEMAYQLISSKEQGTFDKRMILEKWQEIQGVYIPAFYDHSLRPPKSFKRAFVNDLETVFFPVTPVVPFGKPIHDRLRIEVARGCTRGCRFCQAGMVYRPLRERSPGKVIELCREAVGTTGYDNISLLSLSTSDYSGFHGTVETLMDCFEEGHVAISLPSLRAGTISPNLMERIKSVRKTGFTIAPEAGSQRLRDVINKNITEEDIFRTVEDAFSMGWQVIKLYFMIGLPTETHEDLQAIVDLVMRLTAIKGPRNKRGQLNVSITTFIPKPHTPFQWERQLSLEEATRRINWFKDHLRHPKVSLKWQAPSVSVVEGLFARGDRSLSRLLEAAYRLGCKFDGWSDYFSFETWQKAFEAVSVDVPQVNERIRDPMESLPWDHIDMGLKKSFMLREREKAFIGESTKDCRNSECSGCGICDFKSLYPKTFSFDASLKERHKPTSPLPDSSFKDVQFYFSKLENARFLGHLEMVNIFTRAFKKTEIPIKYSKGFHPIARISFGDTLPLGMESERETFLVSMDRNTPAGTMKNSLNAHLPQGITINGFSENIADRSIVSFTYDIHLKQGFFESSAIAWFHSVDEISVCRTNKKGNSVQMNLKDAVQRMECVSSQILRVSIAEVDKRLLRPRDVLIHVFQFSDEQINNTRIIKIHDENYFNQ